MLSITGAAVPKPTPSAPAGNQSVKAQAPAPSAPKPAAAQPQLPPAIKPRGGDAPLVRETVDANELNKDFRRKLDAPADDHISFDGDNDPAPGAAKPKQVEKPAAEEKPAASAPAEEEPFSFGVETPITEVVTDQKTGEKQSRNYAQFPAEWHDILKVLPNAKFALAEKLLPALLANAANAEKLAKQVPTFLHEHQESYLLDPQYRDIQRQTSMAAGEEQHYIQQLQEIKEGRPWYEIVSYDANGQPQYKLHEALGEGKVDIRAETQIMMGLNKISSMRQQGQMAIQQFQAGHAQRLARAAAEFKALDDSVFSKVQEATFSDGDKKYFAHTMGKIPEQFRGHPLAKSLAKATVGYMRLFNAYKAAVEKNNKTAKIKTQEEAAGSVPRNGGGTGQGDFVSFDT